MQRDKSRGDTQAALYQIFKEHFSELYWLAFLLTGDRERSVRAFIKALELASHNPLFQGSMLSAARKLVSLAALATVELELHESAIQSGRATELNFPQCDGRPAHNWVDAHTTTKSDLERAVLSLDVFPRCVLLLTIFEGLPVEEVALLLDADEKLVKTAQGLGLIQLTRNIALGRGWNPAVAVSNLRWSKPRSAAPHI